MTKSFMNCFICSIEHPSLFPVVLNWFGSGLWCLTPLSTIFQLHRGQFYWWRKLEYSKKTTDLSQVTDKLYHKYTSPWTGFKLTTLVVIGTDCTGKSNFHLITTAPMPRTIFSLILLRRWILPNNCWECFSREDLYCCPASCYTRFAHHGKKYC
jgi:hypothetical protein